MGKPAIIEKLEVFLKKHTPPNEECFVVYLLVEIRKILDHENNGKYPTCRFYANWCVHTNHAIIKPQTKILMQEIYDAISNCIVKKLPVDKEPKLIGFISMKKLREELAGFLRDKNLPNSIVESENWVKFQNLLVKVLADQPIYKPCDGIRKFSYSGDGQNEAFAEIECETKPAEYRTFKFEEITK